MALLGSNIVNWTTSLGQAANSPTLTTTGTVRGSYGQQSYPVASPQPIYYQPSVPVIPHNHSEPLHFLDQKGHVHSFDVSHVFKLLGLEW